MSSGRKNKDVPSGVAPSAPSVNCEKVGWAAERVDQYEHDILRHPGAAEEVRRRAGCPLPVLGHHQEARRLQATRTQAAEMRACGAAQVSPARVRPAPAVQLDHNDGLRAARGTWPASRRPRPIAGADGAEHVIVLCLAGHKKAAFFCGRWRCGFAISRRPVLPPDAVSPLCPPIFDMPPPQRHKLAEKPAQDRLQLI